MLTVGETFLGAASTIINLAGFSKLEASDDAGVDGASRRSFCMSSVNEILSDEDADDDDTTDSVFVMIIWKIG